MFRTRHIVVAAVVIMAALAVVAFAGKPAPEPLPPCEGSPIEVYQQDWCGQSMWIEVTDSTNVCDIICTFVKTKKQTCPVMYSWIGGIVVADAASPLGFYFEPSTVRVAEVTAEGLQTTVCMISANPGLYDGGRWYVPSNLTQYR